MDDDATEFLNDEFGAIEGFNSVLDLVGNDRRRKASVYYE